jgi:hypothetical protein
VAGLEKNFVPNIEDPEGFKNLQGLGIRFSFNQLWLFKTASSSCGIFNSEIPHLIKETLC